ncbi:MAG: ANTAR domain-containing protein [Parasporobacterium sp.]|nr:ANTAR domain-containing protein [Parasporobacterium sp.]
MASIIVATPKSNDANRIADTLRKHGMEQVSAVSLGADVLSHANNADYGIVICTKRLNDLSYRELVGYLPDYFEMILLDSGDEYTGDLEHVVRVILPFKYADLINTIEMLEEMLYRRVRKKFKKPKARSPEDEKTLNEAKAVLMERNNMTEPESYRYIQKCSMDTGRSLVETAQMILMLNTDR